MIVVDGRTDEEKLRELLGAGAEETALDFKSTLDLSQRSSKDALDFFKDCVAMCNLPTGGYIVIGVTDDGTPAHDQEPVDVTRFDSADLRSRVAKYVEAPVHLVSQRHVVDGRDVVLVFAQPNPDGLPVPFAAIGQYQDQAGMKTVFREGEVIIREGTSNVRLRYAHWDGLLRTYRERARQEARTEVDALIAQVVAALSSTLTAGGSQGPAVPPLVVGMEWPSFEEALLAHLESHNGIRLQRFLDTATEAAIDGFDEQADEGPSNSYEAALDAIAAVAINSARYNCDDVYDAAVVALRETYEAGGRARTLNVDDVGSDLPSARHWLAVVERVLAIGRFVVAARRYALLPVLVHQPVPVMQDYVYETWIRHAHVAASRRSLLDKNGGALLSAVRQLLGGRRWLRPDVSTPAAFSPGSQIHPDDRLLNHLAEFDLWWCVMAATKSSRRPGRAFYPSCAALHQYRCQPAIDIIATDGHARATAVPDTAEATVARALATVASAAIRESRNYGGFWEGLSPGSAAATFLDAHGVSVAESDW